MARMISGLCSALALWAFSLLLLLDCPSSAAVLASQDFGSGTNCATDGVTTQGTVDCARTDWSVSGDSGWAEGTADFTEDYMEQASFISASQGDLYISFCFRFANPGGSTSSYTDLMSLLDVGGVVRGALQIGLAPGTGSNGTIKACDNQNLLLNSAAVNTPYWIVERYVSSTGLCEAWIDGVKKISVTKSSGYDIRGYRASGGLNFSGINFTAWFDNITFEDAFPSQNACTAGGGGGRTRRFMDPPDLREMLRAWFADSY